MAKDPKVIAKLYKYLQKDRMASRYQDRAIKILNDPKITTIAQAKKKMDSYKKIKAQISKKYARSRT
jgi:hypothetical protein